MHPLLGQQSPLAGSPGPSPCARGAGNSPQKDTRPRVWPFMKTCTADTRALDRDGGVCVYAHVCVRL